MDVNSLFTIACVALAVIAVAETVGIIVILFKYRLVKKA